MADLAASDVTVTCLPQDRGQFNHRLKANFVSIAFGDGAKTIPAGGAIPLPAKAYFALRSIRALIVVAGQGVYQYAYDKANHKLLAYYGDNDAVADGVFVAAAGAAPAAQALEALVIGD